MKGGVCEPCLSEVIGSDHFPGHKVKEKGSGRRLTASNIEIERSRDKNFIHSP